jgi:hypothetical protein
VNRSTLRPADESQALVKEMRTLAQASERAARKPSSQSEERAASIRITTSLMLLLVLVLFVTSALPDLIPRLDQVMTAGL